MENTESRSTLSEDVAHRLIDGIISGRFRFGERLPPERELARYMSVGRATLREALSVLSMLGLVKIRHGEGTFVVENHADFLARAFGWTILLDSQSVDELIDARAAVESMLAELAAQRADVSEIQRLKKLLVRMHDANNDIKSFSKADLEFHLVVAKAARNVTLSRTLLALQSLLKVWVNRALPAATDSFAVVCEQHSALLQAIEARDSTAANSAMRAHLDYVGNLLRLSIHANNEKAGQTVVNGASIAGAGELEI